MGERHLTPFRQIPARLLDTLAPLALRDLPTIAAEPDDPSPSIDFARFLTHLDAAAITALLDVVGRGSGSPLVVRTFFNFLGANDDPTRAFTPESLTRLQRIKRHRRPARRLREQPPRPAPASLTDRFDFK